MYSRDAVPATAAQARVVLALLGKGVQEGREEAVQDRPSGEVMRSRPEAESPLTCVYLTNFHQESSLF